MTIKASRWRRNPWRRKPAPTMAPRPSRVADRIVFHGDGWHYGPCIMAEGKPCALPLRADPVPSLGNGDTLEIPGVGAGDVIDFRGSKS